MSQNAMKRLYLMQVGSMPEYQIPIVCYLVQTGDGKNILIDSGLPEMMPEDTRHSRRRNMLFSVRIIWMRRATHVLLPIDPNGISQWSAFSWWTGTRNCCRGWS